MIPSDAKPLLEPEIESILENTHTYWREQHPTSFSLWGKQIWGCGEDLSDVGLDSWKDNITNLLKQANNINVDMKPPINSIVLKEIVRFLKEQKIKHVDNPIYESRTTSYIQLCIFTVLPFFLDDSLSVEYLDYRIENCIKWLDEGERRYELGMLSFTESDRNIVTKLNDSLDSWNTKGFKKLILLKQTLGKWMALPSVIIKKNSHNIRINDYLESVLQINYSLESLVDILSVRLEQEVEKYFDIRVEKHMHCNSFGTNMNPIERIHIIEENLKQVLKGKTLSNVGSLSNIIKAPELLTPLLQDAMYLPPTVTGHKINDPGWLIFNKMYLSESELSDSKTNSLALAIAHEICPGHSEHIRRGSMSPINKLFDFTRSPIGLEGWAVYSESFITNLEHLLPEVNYSLNFHRLRRLSTALEIVSTFYLGADKAKIKIQRILNLLPDDIKAKLLEINHSNGLGMLPYTVGLIETEKSLKKIKNILRNQKDEKIIETYLSWGPIHPSSVTKLIENYNLKS